MSRIALIHAVQVAMGPIAAAFAELWPEARLVNILDDSLSPDRARDGTLTPAMSQRIAALADYATASGADGILYTCSAFGPAIEAVALDRAAPVLKPNEAMFAEALEGGRSLGMVATFAPSIASMEAEFAEAAAQAGSKASLRTVLAEGAMPALQRGDEATHNRLVADAAATLGDCDMIMLAHFSTARALAETEKRIGTRISTAPHAAVKLLKKRLDDRL